MNNRLGPVVALAAISLLLGCATDNNTSSDNGPRKLYTRKEYGQLTYCVGMSDTAMYVATQKLKGTSIDQMKNYYSSKPSSRVAVATVDKVYGDSFKSAWDYTVSFFNECAQNVADVPANRVNMASYCHQNTLIADVAHAYKVSGAPKERAYAKFAMFKSKTPNEIVDRVYASSKNRAEVKLEVWNRCMDQISEK